MSCTIWIKLQGVRLVATGLTFEVYISRVCVVWSLRNYHIRPFIWRLWHGKFWICLIVRNPVAVTDQSYEFHNAPIPYPTIHHNGAEMCTFLFQNGVLWIWDRCMVGVVRFVYYTTDCATCSYSHGWFRCNASIGSQENNDTSHFSMVFT